MAGKKRGSEREPLTKDECRLLREYWNVPNWTNGEGYKYVESLNDEQIRWEFVRRDNLYRHAWKKQIGQPKDFGLTEFYKPKISGDQLPEGAFTNSSYRGGLLTFPLISLKDLTQEPTEDIIEYQDAMTGRKAQNLIKNGMLILVFNPKYTPTQQIKDAKDILQRQHDYLKSEGMDVVKHKHMPNDPGKLLRVLDADEEGRSDIDIALKLYPNSLEPEKIGAERRRAAKEYQSSFSVAI